MGHWVPLGTNTSECNKTNITDKIAKMTTKLNIWSQRHLTLIGKVLITKSIGISNLVYSLSCVTSNEKDILQVQKQVDKFFWSGRTVKVKHNTLIGNYNMAGIRAPDIATMRKS